MQLEEIYRHPAYMFYASRNSSRSMIGIKPALESMASIEDMVLLLWGWMLAARLSTKRYTCKEWELVDEQAGWDMVVNKIYTNFAEDTPLSTEAVLLLNEAMASLGLIAVPAPPSTPHPGVGLNLQWTCPRPDKNVLSLEGVRVHI